MNSRLYFDINEHQWPIIYRPEYNVHFLGLEKLHPFDAGKWGNIFRFLKNAGIINEKSIVEPREATRDDLLVVHTKKYLKNLNCSLNVAKIAEVPPLIIVPNFIVQHGYLKPMRYQTGGTILAGKLALDRGWAINIGGGFHHCSAQKGGGFCPYADITLCIKFLFNYYSERVKAVMIIDLDAHQGNGYEHDFKNNDKVYIFDVYNRRIYPHDFEARRYINTCIELEPYTGDEEFLCKVSKNLDKALNKFRPSFVIYNAGTDILEGDSLGLLSVTSRGVIKRDEIVFEKVRSRKIPIVMLTSGGYLKRSAKIIATSILNLHGCNLINGPSSRY